jgi:hypothetical protein
LFKFAAPYMSYAAPYMSYTAPYMSFAAPYLSYAAPYLKFATAFFPAQEFGKMKSSSGVTKSRKMTYRGLANSGL